MICLDDLGCVHDQSFLMTKWSLNGNWQLCAGMLWHLLKNWPRIPLTMRRTRKWSLKCSALKVIRHQLLFFRSGNVQLSLDNDLGPGSWHHKWWTTGWFTFQVTVGVVGLAAATSASSTKLSVGQTITGELFQSETVGTCCKRSLWHQTCVFGFWNSFRFKTSVFAFRFVGCYVKFQAPWPGSTRSALFLRRDERDINIFTAFFWRSTVMDTALAVSSRTRGTGSSSTLEQVVMLCASPISLPKSFQPTRQVEIYVAIPVFLSFPAEIDFPKLLFPKFQHNQLLTFSYIFQFFSSIPQVYVGYVSQFPYFVAAQEGDKVEDLRVAKIDGDKIEVTTRPLALGTPLFALKKCVEPRVLKVGILWQIGKLLIVEDDVGKI